MTGGADRIREWQEQGRVHVSPAEAAQVLMCSAEGLRVAAAHGQLAVPHFMTGRNLRILVSGLASLMDAGGPVGPCGVTWIERG